MPLFPFCNKLQKEIKNGLRFLSLPTQCSSFRLAALSSRTPSLSGRPRSSCSSPPGIPLGCLCCSPTTEVSELLPLQQFHVDDSSIFTSKIYFATLLYDKSITILTSNDFQCTILDIRNRSDIKL